MVCRPSYCEPPPPLSYAAPVSLPSFRHATQAAPQEAYFKSTDGHFGNWGFNLRRPNLHLLPLVHSAPNSDSNNATTTARGFILVDSTRAGKRVPDALSKTVPIWCTVLNRAVARAYPEQTASREWDTELYCPPGAVSEQERSQIKEKLDKWAEDLVVSAHCFYSSALMF